MQAFKVSMKGHAYLIEQRESDGLMPRWSSTTVIRDKAAQIVLSGVWNSIHTEIVAPVLGEIIDQGLASSPDGDIYFTEEWLVSWLAERGINMDDPEQDKGLSAVHADARRALWNLRRLRQSSRTEEAIGHLEGALVAIENEARETIGRNKEPAVLI